MQSGFASRDEEGSSHAITGRSAIILLHTELRKWAADKDAPDESVLAAVKRAASELGRAWSEKDVREDVKETIKSVGADARATVELRERVEEVHGGAETFELTHRLILESLPLAGELGMLKSAMKLHARLHELVRMRSGSGACAPSRTLAA